METQKPAPKPLTCDKCGLKKPDVRHGPGSVGPLCNACWFTTKPR